MALSPSSSSLQSADLSTLLRINKGFPFHITYKGNDAVVYQHALSNFFAQNAVTWKRHGKFFPYPLVFPLKFIPFDEKHVFTLDSTVGELKTFAFLHIFFINASSAEEYRNNIRHTVSEWFAGLSSRPELQWLIVVDTTRAKEKKNRSNLMDKIRSDFSKHLHKLIEVCDSVEHASFSSLTGLVQSSLVSHLELLTETWERCLKTGRERHVAKDWDIVNCVNQELEYARLFWSLGALDHSLKLYEELDSFVFFLIVSLAEADPGSPLPVWAERLRVEEMEECPTLLENMRDVKMRKGACTIAGIRHLLLSHKLLLTVHLYHARVHSVKNAPSPGTRCDHAAVVMKYANNTLHGVIEHLILLKSSISSSRLSCWVIQLVGEALYLSCLIADVNTIESAKDAVAAMHSKRFKELLCISELCVEEKKEERETLLNWIDGVMKKREQEEKLTKQHRDTALSLLSSALRSPSFLETTMLRTHDAASSFLTQSGRKRNAAMMGYQLALFLTRQGKTAAALPYYLRFVASLIENGEKSESMLTVIEESIDKLHPKEDYERIIRFLLYLVQSTRDERKREEWSNRLKRELERGRNESLHLIRLTEWTDHMSCPCNVRVSKKTETTKVVPGERLSVGVHLSSSLPSIPLEGVRVRVRLSPLSSHVSPNEKPAFDVEYRLAESRMVWVNRGSKNDSVSVSSRDEEEGIELVHEETISRVDNEGVTLQLEVVVRKTGIFMLKEVEITLCDDALLVVIPPSSITIDKKLLMVIVEETRHSIVFPQGKVYESGVSECLSVCLSSGSLAIPSSTLTVQIEDGDEGDIEFLSEDGLWESLVVLSVSSLDKEEREERLIRLCMPLNGEVTTDVIMRKIRLDWSGRSFVHIVRFSPLFSTRFTNSHLESKMLLDLEVSRPSSSLWSIVPLETSLSIKNALSPIEPSLMYFDRQPIDPRGISSLTWLATPPVDGPPSVPFKLKLRYRVQAIDGREMEKEVDREYEYRLEGDLELKRVQYEVCSQVLSQQPGAQLCRVGTPCHLLVSIRSLSLHETDSLVVTVVTDERLWEIGERSKAVTLKESGLGQVYMMVIPLVPGFLPFPSVQLHAATASIRSEDRFWGDSTDSLPTPPLFTFERTAGKQIRVLGASGGGDGGSISSRGEKKTIKEKLQKLFD